MGTIQADPRPGIAHSSASPRRGWMSGRTKDLSDRATIAGNSRTGMICATTRRSCARIIAACSHYSTRKNALLIGWRRDIDQFSNLEHAQQPRSARKIGKDQPSSPESASFASICGPHSRPPPLCLLCFFAAIKHLELPQKSTKVTKEYRQLPLHRHSLSIAYSGQFKQSLTLPQHMDPAYTTRHTAEAE